MADRTRHARIRCAMVTGASSGLGETFARRLARRNVALLLVALPDDRDRLAKLATELATKYGVRAEALPLDLTESDAPRWLQSEADRLGLEPDLVVNNAGIGMDGRVADLPLERQLAMVRLNVETVVALTRLYLPRMVARRNGAVLNVASTVAFQPVPYMAVYAATKAFVLSFSEALWAENRDNGVRVVAVCPGPIADTEIAERQFMFQITRDDVVLAAIDALERDQPVIVQRVRGFGVVYRLLQGVLSLLPRRRQLIVIERVARKILQVQ